MEDLFEEEDDVEDNGTISRRLPYIFLLEKALFSFLLPIDFSAGHQGKEISLKSPVSTHNLQPMGDHVSNDATIFHTVLWSLQDSNQGSLGYKSHYKPVETTQENNKKIDGTKFG